MELHLRVSWHAQKVVMMTYDPISVAMCYCRQQLKHDRFDFRLQEWMGHIGQKGFEIVLDKWHHNEDPVM